MSTKTKKNHNHIENHPNTKNLKQFRPEQCTFAHNNGTRQQYDIKRMISELVTRGWQTEQHSYIIRCKQGNFEVMLMPRLRLMVWGRKCTMWPQEGARGKAMLQKDISHSALEFKLVLPNSTQL